MILAESLLRALKEHGAHEIFGIPGDFALPFFKVIEESGILPLYTLSHEPAVGFAADAAARLHASLGVAAITYGAGGLNMVNPVAAAYAEKSPVVVISGAPGLHERGAGLLLHHQAKTLESQLAVYREITCEQAVLDDPDSAPEAIARVLRACLDESRPVYVELPRDQVGARVRAVVPLPAITPDPDALAACADEVLEALGAATDPLIIAGVEVRRFGLEGRVAELARRLGLPTVTTFMGRGVFAGTDAPLLGTYLGVAGDPELTRRVEGSDAPFLLGVILSDTNFGISERRLDPRRTLIAADGRVTHRFHTYRGIPLAHLVDALLERVGGRAAKADEVAARADGVSATTTSAGDADGGDGRGGTAVPVDGATAARAGGVRSGARATGGGGEPAGGDGSGTAEGAGAGSSGALGDGKRLAGTAVSGATGCPRGLVADDARIEPIDIARAVNDLMAAEGPIPLAADMGDCLFTALDIDDTELVAPGYYATMGFGVPAGLGVQAATGRRPIVLVGDGAFQMTGWELGNCRRHGWDPLVLLFNNASWEMLRTFQPESAFNDLDDWRYAALADALGGHGRRVTTRAELAAALGAAWRERGRFQLIEIMLERGVLSSALERFAAGVRRLHGAPPADGR